MAGESRAPDEGCDLHPEVLGRLVDALPARGSGTRILLLLAPRAGFGKTHLLARLGEELGSRAVVVPLRFHLERPPSWERIGEELVVALLRGEAAVPGLTRLDVASRFLFARGNRRLIEQGQVPCVDPEGADRALRERFIELFDFNDRRQVVARWFLANFEKLLPKAGAVLAREAGIGERRAAHWLRVLCGYAQGAGEAAGEREQGLRWALADPVESGPTVRGMTLTASFGGGSREAEAEWREKLVDLVRILGLHRPLVFVLDHLDAFHRDHDAGRRIAYLLSELQAAVPRELSILSVNEDLWSSTFDGALPSAFEDRLSANVVNLKGVDLRSAEQLVSARLDSAGVDAETAAGFVRFLRLGDYLAGQAGRLVSPRVVLRYAAIHWEVFAGEGEEGRLAVAMAGDLGGVAPVDVEEEDEVAALQERGEFFPDLTAPGGAVPTPEPAVPVGQPPASGPAPETRSGKGFVEGAIDAISGDEVRIDSVLGSGVTAAIEGVIDDLLDEEEEEAAAGVAEAEARGERPASEDDSGAEPGGLGEEGAARSASDVVDGKNAFDRLKQMLSRLREERARLIESGEVPSAAAPLEEPVVGAGVERDPVGRGVAAGPSEPLSAPPIAEVSAAGVATADAAQADVLARFRAHRVEWEKRLAKRGGEPLALDRIARLVEVAGKRFPVVRFEAFDLPENGSGGSPGSAARWAFGRNEVYFGFRPATHEGFWEQLVSHVAMRSRLHSGGGESGLRVKLAAFAPVSAGTTGGGAGLPGAGPGSTSFAEAPGAEEVVDHILLDRSAVAALYAADELLGEAESGELDADPGTVLGMLASQLDFFWKRLTRPKSAS